MLLSLRQIPFNRFQEFLIDGDLTAIGEGTEEELVEHAQRLQLEFQDAISTDDTNAVAVTTAQIEFYKIKLEITQLLIDVLKIKYDERLVELLIEEGFSGCFSEETILEDLERVVAQSQQYVNLKTDLEKQLELMNEGSKPATYEYYTSVLIAISNMVKYSVSDDISTLKFCGYFKQLITSIEKKEENGR